MKFKYSPSVVSKLMREPNHLQEYMMLLEILRSLEKDFGKSAENSNSEEMVLSYLDILWGRMSKDEIDYFNRKQKRGEK